MIYICFKMDTIKIMNAYNLFFSFLCSRLIVAANKCVFTNVSTGLEEWRCCDNWVDKNRICFECPNGSRSLYGERCKKCDDGYYGRKCGSRCHCAQYQTCDPVDGCTNITSSTIQHTIDVTEQIVSNRQKTTVVFNSKQVITENPANSPEFLEREIVIYSISTGLLTTFILLGTVLLKRYRRINNAFHNERPGHIINIENITPENDSTDEMAEGIYETIDESNLIDLPIQVEEPDVTSSSTSSTSSKSMNVDPSFSDSYANPYQPIISDPEIRVYNLIHKVPSDSGSSIEYGNNNGSGYLHPYQTIVTVHEYSSIHIPKGPNLIIRGVDELSFNSNNCPDLVTSDNAKRYRSLPNLKIEKDYHRLTKHNSDSIIRTIDRFFTICEAPANQQIANFDNKATTSHTTESAAIKKRSGSEKVSDHIPYIQISDLLNENVY